MTVPRSRSAAQPRRVVRRVARPSRPASSMSAAAGSPATTGAASSGSPRRLPAPPQDAAEASACASSTVPAARRAPPRPGRPRPERRASQARTAAVRRLIAAYEPGTAPSWPRASTPRGGPPAGGGRPRSPEEGFFRAGRTRPDPGSAPDGPPGRGPLGRSWPVRVGTSTPAHRPRCGRLYWLGQQYAARSDVLQVLLGPVAWLPGRGQPASDPSPDPGRWEDRGLIARDWLLGDQWVVPPRALQLVGLDVRGWSFVIPNSPIHAVGVVGSPWSQHPRGWPLAQRAGAAARGRQEPGTLDAAIELPEDPNTRAGSGLYGEDVDPLPKRVAVEVDWTRKGAAGCARPGPDPRLAAGPGPLHAPPRSPATHRPAPASGPPSHPGPPAARGARDQLPALWRCS